MRYFAFGITGFLAVGAVSLTAGCGPKEDTAQAPPPPVYGAPAASLPSPAADAPAVSAPHNAPPAAEAPAVSAPPMAQGGGAPPAGPMMGAPGGGDPNAPLTPTPQMDTKIAGLEKGGDKKALAAAYADRGYTRMTDDNAGRKLKYRAALDDYRKALAADPANKKAKDGKELIEGIYKQLGLPVPGA